MLLLENLGMNHNHNTIHYTTYVCVNIPYYLCYSPQLNIAFANTKRNRVFTCTGTLHLILNGRPNAIDHLHISNLILELYCFIGVISL